MMDLNFMVLMEDGGRWELGGGSRSVSLKGTLSLPLPACLLSGSCETTDFLCHKLQLP